MIPEEVLQRALRDDRGAIALAHLRRYDEDRWDFLAVDVDLQPLTFWAAHGETAPAGASVRDDGAVKFVVMATAPGVEISGLMAVPADEWDSPAERLLVLVDRAGEIYMEDPDEHALPPQSLKGELDELLAEVKKTEHEHAIAIEVGTSKGGSAAVLIDWDDRPILVWTTIPADIPRRELMTPVLLHSGGSALVVVDRTLRPIFSTDELRERLGA
jgi:hypothetical protein